MTAGGRNPRFPLALAQLDTGCRVARGDAVRRPQQRAVPVQRATVGDVRPLPRAGFGLDSAAVRQRMVTRLREGGVGHDAVLAAFAKVERHRFVDSALAGQAYEDTSLPIGLQQTISKPSVVAHMLSLLADGAWARENGQLGQVLEIGTGSGYQAALLVELGRRVVSVERLLPLHQRAARLLAPDCARGVLRLLHGDGHHGHAPLAPFQSIVAAAGGEALPAAWLDQLARGGRLVAPMHDGPRGQQVLCVVDRLSSGALRTQCHDAVRFVPLKSGVA